MDKRLKLTGVATIKVDKDKIIVESSQSLKKWTDKIGQQLSIQGQKCILKGVKLDPKGNILLIPSQDIWMDGYPYISVYTDKVDKKEEGERVCLNCRKNPPRESKVFKTIFCAPCINY